MQLSVRAGTAAAMAAAIAQQLGFGSPSYAVIGAVIVTDLSPARTRHLAIQRMVGTVIGAAVGGAVSGVAGAGSWSVAVGIVIAIFVCQVFRLEAAAKLAGFVCGIIVLGHSADPWSYSWNRLIETILGIVVAVIVSYVPKIMRAEPADTA